MAESNADNPSMDDILNTIRGVIAGDDDKDPSKPTNNPSEQKEAAPQASADVPEENKVQEGSSSDASIEGDEEEDVLELTDIIEDGEAMSEASVNTPEENGSEGLLDDIDNMLGGEDDIVEEAEAFAEPQASAQPEEAQEASAPNEDEALEEPAQEAEVQQDDVIASTEPEAEPAVESESEAQPQQEEVQEEVKVNKVESQHPSDRLLSETAAATSQAVLKEMMNALPRQKVDSPATRGGTTLEDLVIEAIRPYLSEWMDKNLATIVKQLVEKEIKHLIPRDVE